MLRYVLCVAISCSPLQAYELGNLQYGLKVVESQSHMEQDVRHENSVVTYKNLWYKSCPLNACSLSGARLENVHFTRCSATEFNLSSATVNGGELQSFSSGSIDFSNASLQEVFLRDLTSDRITCANTIFNGCVLEGIGSEGLVLDGTTFIASSLCGLNWESAEIKSCIIDTETRIDGLIISACAAQNISIQGKENLDVQGVLAYLKNKGAQIMFSDNENVDDLSEKELEEPKFIQGENELRRRRMESPSSAQNPEVEVLDEGNNNRSLFSVRSLLGFLQLDGCFPVMEGEHED